MSPHMKFTNLQDVAILFFFFFLHKSNQNLIARETYHRLERNNKNPRASRNKYPSKGQTFPVTTKLLRVTIRPLTHQTESNLLRTILISHVRRKVTVLLNGPNFKPLHGGIFGLALPSVQDLTRSETK